MNNHLRNLLVSKSLASLISGFILISLPLYLLDLGVNLDRIGYVFSIAMIFYGLLSFYLGSYSESSGRLWIGVLAIIGMIISSFFFGILPFFSLTLALVAFTISKILFKLSESVLRNIVKIRVLDLSDSKRLGHSFGLLILADSLGNGVGMILAGTILLWLSLQKLFFGLSILLLVSLIFYRLSGDIGVRAKKEKIFKISNLTKTSRLFKVILLLNTLSLLGAYPVDFFGLPLFQKEVLGMTNVQIFLLMGSAWLIYGFLSRIGGKLFDKYGTKIFMVSLFLISITSVAMAFAKTILSFSILLIIDYIFFSVTDPAGWALAGFVSKDKKGMLMSFFELFGVLAGATVILFFGKLVNIFNFEFIFIFRAATHLAGMLLLFYVNKLIKEQQFSIEHAQK